nr:hypothetical protein [Tanacetum cinerariifolium]
DTTPYLTSYGDTAPYPEETLLLTSYADTTPSSLPLDLSLEVLLVMSSRERFFLLLLVLIICHILMMKAQVTLLLHTPKKNGMSSYNESWSSEQRVFKDPKVCKTAIEQFPIPTEVHRIETLSQEALTSRYARQTLSFKQQSDDMRQQTGFAVRANEEIARLTSKIGALQSKATKEVIAAEKEKVDEELVKAKSQLEL